MVTRDSGPEQIELHRVQVLGRVLDRTLNALSQHWKIHWFTAIGEDGVVVGVTFDLRHGDVVATHYRGSPVAHVCCAGSGCRLS